MQSEVFQDYGTAAVPRDVVTGTDRGLTEDKREHPHVFSSGLGVRAARYW